MSFHQELSESDLAALQNISQQAARRMFRGLPVTRAVVFRVLERFQSQKAGKNSWNGRQSALFLFGVSQWLRIRDSGPGADAVLGGAEAVTAAFVLPLSGANDELTSAAVRRQLHNERARSWAVQSPGCTEAFGQTFTAALRGGGYKVASSFARDLQTAFGLVWFAHHPEELAALLATSSSVRRVA